MNGLKIRDVTECAIFVAILTVISQISLPIALVPITIQVLALSLIGYYLSIKKASATIFVYLLLGLVGVPVFSSLQGGIQVLLSYTGGFILGFIPLVLLCSVCNRKRIGILLGILGLIICHTLGILWYSYIAQLSILNSFLVISLPYFAKDLVLLILGYFIARLIEKKTKMTIDKSF